MKRPSRFSVSFLTVKWMIVAWAFVYLLLDNGSLALQQASLDRQVQRLKQLDADQIQSIARSQKMQSVAKRRVFNDHAARKRLSKMFSWCRTSEDMVVRSGERVVAQSIIMSSRHTRLLLFVPHTSRKLQSAHKVRFGIVEAEPSSRSEKTKVLRQEDPSNWKSVFTLEKIEPGPNQIDFVIDDQDNPFRLKVFVNDAVQWSCPMTPARVTGCSHENGFRYLFPNQVSIKSVTNSRSLRPPQNELIKRTFYLERQSSPGLQGKVQRVDLVLRCWIESDDRVCDSANEVAANFPTIVNSSLKARLLKSEDIPKLFEQCDRVGRIGFGKQFVDRIHNAPSL